MDLLAPVHPPIAPLDVRFIRLGPGDVWAERCFANGELRFGAHHEPHDLALQGDWDRVRQAMLEAGKTAQAAGDTVREMQAFYTLPESTLWVTLAGGQLWWAFADPQVIDLRGEPGEHGAVMRRVPAWHAHTIRGEALEESRLSTRLTQLRAYRRTICEVADKAALIRLINGVEEPSVGRALAAEAELVAAAGALIERLHWRDFEVLADLLVTRSGWQRASALGGLQADADLVVEQPATGERAMVQVKSSADQATLERYASVARARGDDRLFFICHSPKGRLHSDDPGVHVWTGDFLAQRVIRTGLFDWLVDHSR